MAPSCSTRMIRKAVKKRDKKDECKKLNWYKVNTKIVHQTLKSKLLETWQVSALYQSSSSCCFSPLHLFLTAIAWFQTLKDCVRVCKLWDKQLLIHIAGKNTPRFTKVPSLVLIRLVLTKIRRLKNVLIYKEMCGRPKELRDYYYRESFYPKENFRFLQKLPQLA